MKRRKYELPIYAKLEHIKIDLEKLKTSLKMIEHLYIDVRKANPALCDNHMELSDSVYDNFSQINLTTIKGPPLPYTENIKERIKRKEERLYNHPTEHFKDTYFEEILKQFKCPQMRVRITKLAPHTNIPFHIDYDPTYATRIVIPIHTNELVINQFKVRNEIVAANLCAGNAYFLNTGFSHAVFNNSDEHRVAFMFSLDGQEDIKSI